MNNRTNTDKEIQYINALAPYDHGVWTGNLKDGLKIEVGNNALFNKRSEWLVNRIYNFLTKKFSKSELSKMSILEIGCYDGWVLTKLCQNIKFKEAIGIEPREKNIMKGALGRKLSNLKTYCVFKKGNLDNFEKKIKGKKFDFVMCLGMIHHMSSTYDTISKLTKFSNKISIINTMVIPDLENDKKLIEPFVNTKDVIYQDEDKLWSIAAFKYESPYGDGSTDNLKIVNLPTENLLNMSLKLSGFRKLEILGTEKNYYDKSSQIIRGVKEILGFSEKNHIEEFSWKNKVKDVETFFCRTVLPSNIIVGLCKLKFFSELDLINDIKFLENLNKIKLDSTRMSLIETIIKKPPEKKFKKYFDKISNEQFSILCLIFRCPFEKSLFEISKYFYYNNLENLALKYFTLIISKPGCDWWTYYRSCYLMTKIYKNQNDLKEYDRIKKLLNLSNENFPLE